VSIADAAPDRARRFGGVERLYGARAMERFCTARVLVVGLGGVGSWAAEALARSGVARLVLVDLDHVAESNTNRQVHALEGEYGRSKAGAMAARIRAIDPQASPEPVEEFLDEDNCARLLAGADLVLDCIDAVRAKAALVVRARELGIPALVCGGAGGRTDPGRIRTGDLARATGDPLLASLRHRLRHEHGFPGAGRDGRSAPPMGVEVVWSDEPARPQPQGECAPGAPLACAGYGSSVAVTAAFGLHAASRGLALLSEGL